MRPTWHNGRIAALACAAACGALASSVSAATGPVAGLDPAALEVMNQPAYANGQWFISVRDLDTGAPLISLNADSLVEPGSVVKTYSMGAGWQQFGPDHQVVTPVKRAGRVTGGRLRGNLILVGQGDMTMGGRTKPNGDVDFTNLDHNDANDLPGATLTPENPLTGLDQLAQRSGRAAMRRRVRRRHRRRPALRDIPPSKNGPATRIGIDRRHRLQTTRQPGPDGQRGHAAGRRPVEGHQPGADGGGRRHDEDQGDVAAARPGGAHRHDRRRQRPGGRTRTPSRTRRGTRAPRSSRRCAAPASKVKANAVAADPERLLPSKDAVTALPAVARLESLSLDQEATYVLKVSYNRGAKTMICLLAVAAGSTKCDDGLPKAQQIWSAAGLDTDGAVLIDGSGLTGNLITADNQVQLQTIMARRPDAAAWQATLPILGVDGSLALVQPGGPATGKVFAKTGTLASGDLFNDRILFPAKALGGYMDARSGRRLAFAIVAANSVFTTIEGAFAANDDVGKVATIIQQSF